MAEAPREEDRRQFRPYRRLVQVVFAVAIIVLCSFVIRGIVRHLDRMPSVEEFQRAELIDGRALRACADDLEKLEATIRLTAGRRISQLAAPTRTAGDAWEDLERQRLTIIARCRLDDPGDDPVGRHLQTAADDVELLIRAFALLEERHSKANRGYSTEALQSLERAREIINSRKE